MTADDDTATLHTLRRTGRKPLRFTGWQVIEAVGAGAPAKLWHDINIYRTVEGTVVVELIARRQDAGERDLFRVESFPDAQAAAAWLEGYRFADDVPVPAGLSSAEMGLPWAVLHAVQLRQQLGRIEENYRALLSEVFAALDVADQADAPPALSSAA